MKLKQWDKVEIKWVDSISASGTWTWTNELKEDDIQEQMQHSSVGYVIINTPSVISITTSRQIKKNDDGSVSVLAPLHIPKVAITSINKIDNGTK